MTLACNVVLHEYNFSEVTWVEFTERAKAQYSTQKQQLTVFQKLHGNVWAVGTHDG